MSPSFRADPHSGQYPNPIPPRSSKGGQGSGGEGLTEDPIAFDGLMNSMRPVVTHPRKTNKTSAHNGLQLTIP